MRLWYIIFLISLVLFGNCRQRSLHTLEKNRTQLEREIDRVLSEENFDNAHWGVYVVALEDGRELYRWNHNKLFMPASNTKLISTAAACMSLKPDFRYHTPFFVSGKIDNDILNGNLIVRGQGDPSLSPYFFKENRLEVFEQWAQQLKAKGVRTITGDLIGDVGWMTPDYLGQGWAWDYQSDYYAAQLSALCFNDNIIEFTLQYDASQAEKYRLTTQPDIDFLVFDEKKVEIVPPGKATGISIERKLNTNHISFKAAIDTTKSFTSEVTVNDPALFFLTCLSMVLNREGIKLEGRIRTSRDSVELDGLYNQADQIAEYQSPPLSEIIKTILKVSHNLMAEQVFRTMGYYFKGSSGTRSALDVVTTRFFSAAGIDDGRVQLADGSGLSRYNLIAPKDFVRLLEYVYKSDFFQTYYDCLPIAGVDGTIRGRMKNTAAFNNVHAKTGTISNVRALSGYVTTRNGKMLAFSMIANNYTTPVSLATSIQDKICAILAEYELP